MALEGRKEEVMNPDRFISMLPKIEVIAASHDSIYIAEQLITGCEACDPTANRLFTGVLDKITKRTDGLADYILCEAAKCPKCAATILESTLVSLGETDSTSAFD